MSLVPVTNVGEHGIVKDINAWQLPLNVWTDGNNSGSGGSGIVVIRYTI